MLFGKPASTRRVKARGQAFPDHASRAKLAIALENVCEPGKPPRPESAAAFALGDERLPAVGVAVAGAVSVSVRIVRVEIAVGVRCIGVKPAEAEVAAKSTAQAAMTPTAAPV